jgi:hypothetical protein
LRGDWSQPGRNADNVRLTLFVLLPIARTNANTNTNANANANANTNTNTNTNR